MQVSWPDAAARETPAASEAQLAASSKRASLAGIRSLRPDDIPQIGDLFASIFRPGQTVRRSAIEAALARTYLTSPGDLKRPSSLVDTNEDGRIQGFMGI